MALIPRIVKLPSRTFQQYTFCGSNKFFTRLDCIYSTVTRSYNLRPTFPYFAVDKCNHRYYSSDKDVKNNYTKPKVESVTDLSANKQSKRTRLQQAVKDYGSTIIVFHVTIALSSLGLFYLAISNGVDAVKFLRFLGLSESLISSKVAVEGSTFVIAYALHKVFAPVRMGITLSCVPFIVRYLRKIKWLKPPKTPS